MGVDGAATNAKPARVRTRRGSLSTCIRLHQSHPNPIPLSNPQPPILLGWVLGLGQQTAGEAPTSTASLEGEVGGLSSGFRFQVFGPMDQGFGFRAHLDCGFAQLDSPDHVLETRLRVDAVPGYRGLGCDATLSLTLSLSRTLSLNLMRFPRLASGPTLFRGL